MSDDRPDPERLTAAVPVPRVGARQLSSVVDAFIAQIIFAVFDILLVKFVIDPKGTHLDAAQTRTADVLSVLALALTAVVFVAIHAWTGRSVGKWLMKLRIVDLADQRPPVWRLVVKYGVMFAVIRLPFGPILATLGVLYAFSQPQRRNVFDLLAKTAVTPVDAAFAAPD